MIIEFPCPYCKVIQRAGDHLVGRELRCQSCSKRFNVPPKLPDHPADDDLFAEHQPKKTTSKK